MSSQHKVGAYSIFMSQADPDSRAKERYEASVKLLEDFDFAGTEFPKWLIKENKRLVQEYEERQALREKHQAAAAEHMKAFLSLNTNYVGAHEGKRGAKE
jgi:5S rRNA maturation endonuclease (ribonuclease M5)